MNVLRFSKVFFKKHAATILSCLGGIGVAATAVTAVKATPKALKLLEKAENDKGEELSTIEVVKVAGPSYIPSIIVGVSSIACIFGANVLNKRQQAALISAYALLSDSYKKYKVKVEELYGKDADITVRTEIAKDNIDVDDIYPLEDNTMLFYDEFSERYFESTMEKVLQAELNLNHMFSREFGVYLNEWYELLGIDPEPYGDYLGWSAYAVIEMYWYSWIDFKHTKIQLEDGLECTMISIMTEPMFDFENY